MTGRIVTRAWLLRSLLLLTLAGGTVAQDAPPEEWERPWSGFLPHPDQSKARDWRDSTWFGVRAVDARSGQPIAGARLIRTPEWVTPWRRRHDVILATDVADADGIARVRRSPELWDEDSQWLVIAPGYAPSYDYGVVPDWDVQLEPAGRLVARLVDPLGRPVEGSVVEYLAGCSHGTAAARATTKAGGSFVLEDIAPQRGQLWFEGRGIASDLMAASSAWCLGARPGLIVGDPGHRYEGRVVDVLGAPLADVVVRAPNEQRGPATATDAQGRFSLDGVDGTFLLFFPPGDLLDGDSEQYVEDALPGVPMTVVLSPAGVVRAAETARIRVRSRSPDGSPVGGVSFHLLAVRNGRGPNGVTALEPPSDADEQPVGEELLDAAPGAYRVVPDAPLDAMTFDPVVVRAVEGVVTVADLVVREQPRLEIEGEIPTDASLTLAVPGAMAQQFEDPPWRPPVPAAGPAVLVVEREGAPPSFFPVGPESGGTRRVAVDAPPPHRIVLPEGVDVSAEPLWSGEQEVLFREVDGGLETWAEGPVQLRYSDGEDREWEVTVDLPSRPGGRVEVDPSEAHIVAQEEVKAVRRGTASVAFRILDVDGDPVDAVVMISGALHAAPAGELAVGELVAGPHRVLVAYEDEVGGGRELRIVLTEGERRERTVSLGER